MAKTDFFISIDWGTSNFRLRLVNRQTFRIKEEIKTNNGVKQVYDDFIKQKELNQFQFFINYLEKELLKLSDKNRNHSIVISGMASSNIGMLALKYADLPISNNGDTLVVEKFSFKKYQNALLVSGVKGIDDVMRGEEVQALGLVESLNDDGVLILPGTHSKHITFTNGKFTKIKTFLTGELFELLSKKSILSGNVELTEWNEKNKEAFRKGAKIGFSGNLTNSLFSLRVNDLMKKTTKAYNYYFLSGLVFGDEISNLKTAFKTVYLAAPSEINHLYELALKLLLKENQLIVFDQNTYNQALTKGQLKLLKLHEF